MKIKKFLKKHRDILMDMEIEELYETKNYEIKCNPKEEVPCHKCSFSEISFCGIKCQNKSFAITKKVY